MMRTLGKIGATLGVIGTIVASSAVPAAAWYGYHHRYYITTTLIIPTTITVTTGITGISAQGVFLEVCPA